MLERTFCIVLLLTAVLLHDLRKWKSAARRERIVYGALMAPIAYLGFLFVTEVPWPNLDTLFHFLFAAPGKRIVDMFQSGG